MLARQRVALSAIAAVLLFALVPAVYAQDKAPATQPAATSTPTVAGAWTWSTEGFGGTVDFTLTVKQEGDTLTGTLVGFNGEESPIEDGKVAGDQISFKTVRDWGGRDITTLYTLTLAGDTLKGKSQTIIETEIDAKRPGK